MFRSVTLQVESSFHRTFQFEMDGGIFHSARSLSVSVRGGLCSTVLGGEPCAGGI
jgi:hypothetical protein